MGRLDPTSGVAKLWQSDPDKFIRLMAFQQHKVREEEKLMSDPIKGFLPRIGIESIRGEFDQALESVKGTTKRRAESERAFKSVVAQEQTKHTPCLWLGW